MVFIRCLQRNISEVCNQRSAAVVYIRGLQQCYIFQSSEVDIVKKSMVNVCHRIRSFLHCSDVETGGEDLLR
jgi:hypothetical protein